MYSIETTNLFERDYRRCMNRNYDLLLFKEAIYTLEKKGILPQQFKPHPLKGKMKGYWECHIQNDWLLIWRIDKKSKVITLLRTGTHSDLF